MQNLYVEKCPDFILRLKLANYRSNRASCPPSQQEQFDLLIHEIEQQLGEEQAQENLGGSLMSAYHRYLT